MIRASESTVDQIASLSTVWAVMHAARAGAADARAAASGVLSVMSQAFSGGLHSVGFAVGYSATFPACLLARVVPQNNAIVYGLTDGGRAGLDLARSTVTAAANAAAPSPAPVPAIAASLA